MFQSVDPSLSAARGFIALACVGTSRGLAGLSIDNGRALIRSDTLTAFFRSRNVSYQRLPDPATNYPKNHENENTPDMICQISGFTCISSH